jgi:putative membrane protein
VRALAEHLIPLKLPEHFTPVSKLTIRRTIIRYSVVLVLALLPWGYYWRPALWGLLVLAAIPIYAWQYYKNHGYALDEENLIVRRGVFRHYIWVIPITKFQVLYNTDSLFQRRLGLRTVYADTAGAGGWALPEIVDVEEEDANRLIEACYERFQSALAPSSQPDRLEPRLSDPFPGNLDPI